MAYFKHESSYVDLPCEIGDETQIWHFCHIQKGAEIGKRCILGQNVNVAGDVKIGNNVKIQNNVSIYTGTTIEDDVFLGPSCVLTNISNHRSELVRRKLYESTLLRRGCSIGANATVVCGVKVGRFAFVAAGAVVTRDVPDYGLVIGVPGRHVGWMSRHGHRLEFDALGSAHCPESGMQYQLSADGRVHCMSVDEDAALPDRLTVCCKRYGEVKLEPR